MANSGLVMAIDYGIASITVTSTMLQCDILEAVIRQASLLDTLTAARKEGAAWL